MMQQTESSPLGNIWGAALAVWLATMILAGGSSVPYVPIQIFQITSSLAILLFAIWRLRSGFPTALSVWGAVLAGLALALILAQLIPLPAAIWQSMPGRELLQQSFAFFGQPNLSFSLTLSPKLTWSSAIAILPAIAAYLATLTLKKSDFPKLAGVFLVCALVGIGVSFMQKLQGQQSVFYLYGNLGNSNAVGTFANRNFFGAQLYSTIPFIAALAMTARETFRNKGIVVAGLAIVYVAILVIGLGTTGARSALLFSIVSVMVTLVYVYRLNAGENNRFQFSKAILAFVVLLALLSQVGMVALLRVAKSDQVSDYRDIIYRTSYETAQAFFPFGSGFGTFAHVYQAFEKPENIFDRYVNHAHNDWLELVLEGGLPAALLLSVFVVMFVIAVARTSKVAFSKTDAAYARAAVVAATLLLLHSVVDYPLRTPAMMVFFAICCGLIVTSTAVSKSHVKSRGVQAPTDPAAGTKRKPWKPNRVETTV